MPDPSSPLFYAPIYWFCTRMKKLLQGIVDFRRNVQPGYREKFARLALGQSPDALLIACSDSRVVPNVFASADPGDLFVVRNVGNLIAPASDDGHSRKDASEAAAIEFALEHLDVRDIIVCGHSECGAMHALLKGRETARPFHLRYWLRHADDAVARLERGQVPDPTLAPHDQLSQLNVLTQLDHLRSYPLVRERVEARRLRLHAWWFELKNADVYTYDETAKRFIVIEDQVAERLLQSLA
jgi:carbonic anhydrase